MRYIPNTDIDCKKMLQEIGISSIEEILSNIPEKIRLKNRLNLPEGLSELELISHIKSLCRKNSDIEEYPSFLGAGTYNHFIPSVVDRLISRSEFYTSYTPYQPEISQGTLQGIFEFQTLICQLTNMEIANASMYDGASALAEAVIMAMRIAGRKEILISGLAHPEYTDVVKTYTSNLQAIIRRVPYISKNGITDIEWIKDNISDKTSAVVIQSPNFFGSIEDLKAVEEITHQYGALFIVNVVEPMSLGLLKPPGDFNADIVVGEGQSFGNTISFGGPHVGIFAAKKRYVRNIPGRIAGQTADRDGNQGFVLTLSTREQHIRRDKATSNICSNESLCCLAACIYLSALGKRGLKEAALLNLKKAHYAKDKMSSIPGFKLRFDNHIFNEFVVDVPEEPAIINKKLFKNKIIGGLDLSRFYPEMKKSMLFCVTEMISRGEIDKLCDVLENDSR